VKSLSRKLRKRSRANLKYPKNLQLKLINIGFHKLNTAAPILRLEHMRTPFRSNPALGSSWEKKYL